MRFFHRPLRNILVLAFCTVVAGAGQAFAQQPREAGTSVSTTAPAVDSGTVTVPFGEWKALWEAAQPKPVLPTSPKPPAPPVSFSVQSARYEIDLAAGARQANGKVVFEIADLVEGWTSVPLFSTKEARVLSVEPEGTLVTVNEGFYTLQMDAPGHRSITLRFSTDLAEINSSRAHSLHLTGPSALVNEVRVSGVPDGWGAEIQDASSGNIAAPASGNAIQGGGPLVFELSTDLPIVLTVVSAEDLRPAPAPVPSPWQGQSQSFVRYDEGQLVYETRIRLSADSGTGLTAELALPVAANILSVDGTDLDHWRVVKPRADGERLMEVSWKTPETMRRELTLKYELPQASEDGDWHLVSPQVASAASRLDGALYVLPMIDGLEFGSSNEAGTTLTTGNVQRLSRWLAELIGERTFVVISADRPAPASNSDTLVRVRRLPLIQTARATVEESRFRTRLVGDGALLSEGSLIVRHDGPLSLTLKLPASAQLLSCAVNGHDTLPIDRGEGRIDLNLPSGGVSKPTQVDLSYTDRVPAFAPVAGRIAVSLPETDLFVQTVRWDLQIPAEYELTALEGNVSLVTGIPGRPNDPPLIHLQKDLLKAEKPTAEFFYQKRAVAP